MKKIVMAILILGVLQSIAFGITGLELDLFKCSINDIPLLDLQSDSPELNRLLGNSNGYSLSSLNECDVFFYRKGIIISYSSQLKLESVVVYLRETYDSKKLISPFPGKISKGITGETKVDELPVLFEGYNQKQINIDEHTNFVLIDLKRHFLYCFYDLGTKKLTHIEMRYKDWSAYAPKK